MTRRDVEDHLRSENVEFRQMCCVEGNLSKGVYDDLAKISQEDTPWYCSEENVYVAFQFTGPARNTIGWTADAFDKLRAVTIFRWLEGASDEPRLDAVVIKKRQLTIISVRPPRTT